jgi:hypothetical protein
MADEDRPKPPNIEPPKIVPGKETARNIGIDTAFIDGLAAGLVDPDDVQPPAPPKRAAPKKPPAPRGLSEKSGQLFRTPSEPEAKADEDPLAALLPDLDAEPQSAGTSTFVTPERKNDLLARLAAKDDDDSGAVSLTPAPPPPAPKGASESSGLSRRGRSEASGNVALPKGSEAPVFDPKPKAKAKAKAADEEAKAKAAEPKKPAAKKKKPDEERAKPASKPERTRAPVPAVAAAGGAFDNVHPGVWLLLAAVLFGLVVPVLAGGFGGGHEGAKKPRKADAARRVDARRNAAAPADGDRDEPEPDDGAADEEPEAPLDDEAVAGAAEEDEEIVELELEEDGEPEAGGGDGSKARRKSGGGGSDEHKSASQLLTEAKAAYSQGRNGEAYRLASQSNRQRPSEDALTVRAKAACRMGNEAAAKRAFDALPMGTARREVRPICRDKGIRLGL